MQDIDFLNLIRKITIAGKPTQQEVQLPTLVFSELIKHAVADQFDEEWYLERYPDVAKAIEKGTEISGLNHYAKSGLFEGRMPYAVSLDEKDYLERHRDVAASVKTGKTISARDHFYMTGFVEGRTFQLETQADS